MGDILIQKADSMYNDNARVLSLLSQYLSASADFIDAQMMEEMSLGDSPKMQEYTLILSRATSFMLFSNHKGSIFR